MKKIFLIVICIGIFVYLISISERHKEKRPTEFSEQKIWINGKEQAIHSTIPKRELGPKLKIKIQKSIYEYGYLKVIGVIENVGDKPAFSPTIKLKVYDSSLKTLLAEDTAWPAGHYLKSMDPGVSAAFQCIESIPGEPGHIRYEVMIEKYDFDVVYR
jgi:hypothetical protein